MLREDGFVHGRRHHLAPRRAALHHDHDHGQCRQGDAASRILPPGAVAGARCAAGLGDRAMGAIFGRRSALARRAAPSSSTRRSTSPTRPSPAWPRASSPSAAACRRGCSASPSPANWPTRSPCRRATATPRSAALMQAGAEFGITPLRHRGAGRACASRRVMSPATRSTGRPRRAISGSAGMVSAEKDYIGRVLAGRPALLEPDRPTLVGVKPRRPSAIARRPARISFPLVREPVTGQRRRLSDLGRLLAEARPRDRPRLSGERARRASASTSAPSICCAGTTSNASICLAGIRRR